MKSLINDIYSLEREREIWVLENINKERFIFCSNKTKTKRLDYQWLDIIIAYVEWGQNYV